MINVLVLKRLAVKICHKKTANQKANGVSKEQPRTGYKHGYISHLFKQSNIEINTIEMLQNKYYISHNPARSLVLHT